MDLVKSNIFGQNTDGKWFFSQMSLPLPLHDYFLLSLSHFSKELRAAQ